MRATTAPWAAQEPRRRDDDEPRADRPRTPTPPGPGLFPMRPHDVMVAQARSTIVRLASACDAGPPRRTPCRSTMRRASSRWASSTVCTSGTRRCSAGSSQRRHRGGAVRRDHVRPSSPRGPVARRPARLLTTVERKATLMEERGIDVLLVLPFDRDFSLIPRRPSSPRPSSRGARRACRDGGQLHVRVQALGTMQTLPDLGAPFGLTAEAVPLVELGGRTVSSTSIRDALAEGDLAWPLEALGRRFVLDGEVVTGHGRGKGLGYPTANLRTWPRLLLPGQGIYAGVAEHGGRRYRTALDVGTNPTLGSSHCTSRLPARLRRPRPARRALGDRVLGTSPRRGAVRGHRGAGGRDRSRRGALPP